MTNLIKLTKLTKVQLLARIDELERECAAAFAERDALLIEQRPSRRAPVEQVVSRPDSNTEVRIFTNRFGVRMRKTIERHGSRVITRTSEVTQ